ncbi:hypothetical protein EIL87_01195 [Saccharopolyspora rhizosphaerae]|uniref:ASCH domain-containing protein n=1 Tax=Saccharopolyspora rhizosphaerae TaxID=2492662 RepID=A0A3R8PAU7_9PSEU|nr:hypothetical protein [Saccharopolyspora rhizosphaerae]RRO20537.1 hypothetical protein EIL87_01195 [Saccharopolyspora rhizosphaerae]
MLSERIARGVAAGQITHTYFRWPSPQARPGARVPTRAGLIEITSLTEVDPAELTDDDAARAGFSSAAGLRASLSRHRGATYRLELTHLGHPGTPAPQPAPLEQARRRELQAQLARLDLGTPRGPWTRRLLELLRTHPGMSPAEVAAAQQRPVSRTKTDLWRLRELGLLDTTAEGLRLSGLALSYLDAP